MFLLYSIANTLFKVSIISIRIHLDLYNIQDKNKDKWENKLNGTFRKKSVKNTERSNKNKSNKKVEKEEYKDKNNMAMEPAELTERQRLFAEEFARVPIAYKAAIKAGYSPDRAFITGSELVRNRKVRTYIYKLIFNRLAFFIYFIFYYMLFIMLIFKVFSNCI